MKKFIQKTGGLFVLVAIFIVWSTSCEKVKDTIEEISNFLESDVQEAITEIYNETGYAVGWIEDEEDLSDVEDDINLNSMGNTTLPSSVDLTDKFPPIGDQGRYGTCVAWAVGYNLKTFLEGKDNELSSSQLTQSSNQFSPKYLFWKIPVEQKGADCNGTGFEYALDVMLESGVAKMSAVPYNDLGDCTGSTSSWDGTASDYKIESYRKIAEEGSVDLNTIKTYLSQGRAVVIGAKLGDNFMQWNSDAIISYDTYLNPGMQHAYHAMILSGYDDAKEAFRVVNSWNTTWGDDGYIWVDYDFFVNEFCFAAFVATNNRSNPDNDNDNIVDPDERTSGKDLLAWELNDFDMADESDPTYRSIHYNVFNSGEETIFATERWNIIYIYYNAYDAEDFGILLYDYYTDEYGNPENYWSGYVDDELGNNGSFNDIGETGDGLSGNWWNNCDVAPGISVANALYSTTDTFGFEWGYKMPETVDGYYYMVLIADGYDVIAEFSEDNNYYFFTDAYGDPLSVSDGVIQGGYKKSAIHKAPPEKFAPSPYGNVKKGKNLNTYSTNEIRAMLKYYKKTGLLQEKIEKYVREKKAVQLRKKGY